MYDFDDFTIDERLLKQTPQFANLTIREIRILLDTIARWENNAWYEERDARLAKERAEDSRYAETCKDPVLPNGDVKILKGIIILPNKLDARGFISVDTIALGLKRFKLSLEGKGSIYI